MSIVNSVLIANRYIFLFGCGGANVPGRDTHDARKLLTLTPPIHLGEGLTTRFACPDRNDALERFLVSGRISVIQGLDCVPGGGMCAFVSSKPSSFVRVAVWLIQGGVVWRKPFGTLGCFAGSDACPARITPRSCRRRMRYRGRANVGSRVVVASSEHSCCKGEDPDSGQGLCSHVSPHTPSRGVRLST